MVPFSDPARPIMLPRNTKLFSSSTIGRPDGTDIGCTVSTPTRNASGPLGPGETYHQFTAAINGTFTATESVVRA